MSTKQYYMLAPPPSCGRLSLSAQKLMNEVFLFIISIILLGVWGDNRGRVNCSGTSLCGWYLFMAIVSFLIMTFVVCVNFLIELRMAKRETLPFSTERTLFLGYAFFWTIGIITFNLNSNPYRTIRNAQSIVTFAWFTFVFTIYNCFILFHLGLEEKAYKQLTAEWEEELARNEEAMARARGG